MDWTCVLFNYFALCTNIPTPLPPPLTPLPLSFPPQGVLYKLITDMGYLDEHGYICVAVAGGHVEGQGILLFTIQMLKQDGI